MILAFAPGGKIDCFGGMFKRGFNPLLLVALMFLGSAAVFYWTITSPRWQSLRKIGTVMSLINHDYVDADRADYDRLAEAAITGMLQSLDAHSRFLPADDFAHFEQITQQEYVGIGVRIEAFDDAVTVVSCFPGSPAAEAGLRAGDRFFAINGEVVEGKSVVEVSKRLRGPADQAAQVTMRRDGSPALLDFSFKRRAVAIASVEPVRLEAGGIGYVRVRQFGERTAREFGDALDQLEGEGMEALILDLRDNPGGLLRIAKEVASEFFQRGELVVYTEGREFIDREEFRSSTPARPREYPIAVLINERSASGAEIVAGALQDTAKAFLIGAKTYGKGSVQSIYAFREGGGLQQTTALYYLPSGRSINEVGIAPDREVPVSEEDAYRLMLQERHEGHLDAEAFERHFGYPDDLPDRQLEAARAYLEEALAERGARRA